MASREQIAAEAAAIVNGVRARAMGIDLDRYGRRESPKLTTWRPDELRALNRDIAEARARAEAASSAETVLVGLYDGRLTLGTKRAA